MDNLYLILVLKLLNILRNHYHAMINKIMQLLVFIAMIVL